MKTQLSNPDNIVTISTSTAPPVIIERVEVEPPGPPIIRDFCVFVEPRGNNADTSNVSQTEKTGKKSKPSKAKAQQKSSPIVESTIKLINQQSQSTSSSNDSSANTANTSTTTNDSPHVINEQFIREVIHAKRKEAKLTKHRHFLTKKHDKPAAAAAATTTTSKHLHQRSGQKQPKPTSNENNTAEQHELLKPDILATAASQLVSETEKNRKILNEEITHLRENKERLAATTVTTETVSSSSIDLDRANSRRGNDEENEEQIANTTMNEEMSANFDEELAIIIKSDGGANNNNNVNSANKLNGNYNFDISFYCITLYHLFRVYFLFDYS